MGGEPPPPPQVLRPARGHPQPPAEGLLVEPHGLDPREGPRGVGSFAHPRLREVPRARLARSEPVRPDAALRRRALLRVRLDGPLLRLLSLDRPALARHVLDQQRHARLRPPRVRDDRRLAQQLPVRARHDGRGLAQQPPLGARLGGAGLRLVAGGRELRHSLARREARAGARPSPPAGALARGRARGRSDRARFHVGPPPRARAGPDAPVGRGARLRALDRARRDLRARSGAPARGRALDRLHEEASAAGARAGRRLDEIHAEIEKARAHLAEILERLVAAADSLRMPRPEPG